MILPKMLQVGVFWTILNPPWSARRLDCKDYRHKRPKTCEGQSSIHIHVRKELLLHVDQQIWTLHLLCQKKMCFWFGSKNSTCSTILGPSASPRMAEKLRSCGSLASGNDALLAVKKEQQSKNDRRKELELQKQVGYRWNYAKWWAL